MAIVLALYSASSAWAHDGASVARYLANEGVMVTSGTVKVLFDAFYADGYDTYLLVPDGDRQGLMNDTPPFDGIDAIFVSHVHGDHFTAAPTLAYLRKHPDVLLYGPEQVATALAEAASSDDPVLKQITAFGLSPGDEPEVVNLENLSIDVIAIPHVGGARTASVSNLVFRVTLDGLSTVVHLGDSSMDEVLFWDSQPHWDAKPTHTAFAPYWFIGNEIGDLILSENIKAGEVIGIHVPAESKGDGEAWRSRLGGDLFTDPGETRAVGHAHAADNTL